MKTKDPTNRIIVDEVRKIECYNCGAYYKPHVHKCPRCHTANLDRWKGFLAGALDRPDKVDIDES